MKHRTLSVICEQPGDDKCVNETGTHPASMNAALNSAVLISNTLHSCNCFLLHVFQVNQLNIYSSNIIIIIIPGDKAYQLQVCILKTFFFIFLLQVPSDKTDAILSLPLLELAGRLQEGSLSPRTVLYTYIQKVSAYLHPEGQIAYVIRAVMYGMVTC